MMQTMSEIHSYIKSQYVKLQNDIEREKQQYKDNLYALYPRIEEIDNEISTLAISSARRVLEEKISPEEATVSMKKKADELKIERQHILQSANISDFNAKYQCEFCKDTGFVSDGKKCKCYIKKLNSLVQLPGENINSDADFFKNSVFGNFDLSYYPDEIDQTCGSSPKKIMKMNLAKCIKFSNDFTGVNSGNLLLYGPSGLGKSFMAACIYNRVSERGYFALYKSSYRLFQFLEDCKFGRINLEEYNLSYKIIYDCDLLIIDDFGTEFITSYTQSVFFDLLNTRLINGKSTIISTNLKSEELKNIYQERVTSRLENEFTNLLFCGNDIRRIKSNAF